MSDTARVRQFALVGVALAGRKAEHTAGYPLDPSRMLPFADVVLLIADDDPGAMAFRYTVAGESGGDTWHPGVDDAREQLADEYGEALSPWFTVPADVVDPHRFVIQYATDQFNRR